MRGVSHLLAAVLGGVVEGELGHAIRLLARNNLQALDHPRHRFVLERRDCQNAKSVAFPGSESEWEGPQSAELTLSLDLLPDDDHVDVLVARPDARPALDHGHVAKQVELLLELHRH